MPIWIHLPFVVKRTHFLEFFVGYINKYGFTLGKQFAFFVAYLSGRKCNPVTSSCQFSSHNNRLLSWHSLAKAHFDFASKHEFFGSSLCCASRTFIQHGADHTAMHNTGVAAKILWNL